MARGVEIASGLNAKGANTMSEQQGQREAQFKAIEQEMARVRREIENGRTQGLQDSAHQRELCAELDILSHRYLDMFGNNTSPATKQ